MFMRKESAIGSAKRGSPSSRQLPDIRLAAFLVRVDVELRDPARRKKNKYLADNFAPVSAETTHQDLKVVGKLPKALDGVYARTGPNPVLPISGDYHWFDGDGMVHACRIKDGKVAYSNRLVQTNRLKRERKLGFSVYQRFGDMRGFWGVFHAGLGALRMKLGVTPQNEGVGTANTALVYHANKLLALHEGDLPYAMRVLCDGIVDTLGRITFGGKVKHPFTAHPKVDPITGELFFIGYQMDKKPPCVWYSGLDKDGQLQFDVKVDLKEGVMMHDMAITQDYAILLDVPLCFRPEVMVTHNRLPFVYDKSRPARFGFLPKRPKSGKEVVWLELPAVMIFHVANAWQESKDVVKLFACCFEDFDLDIGEEEMPDSAQPRMREMTFNLATGEATSRQLADVICDFPRVPEHLTGLRTRYAYAASMDTTKLAGNFEGIVKFDMSATNGGTVAGRLSHGTNRWGGEAVFVSASAAEDDGYLMTYVHDENRNKSELVVYDARTMSAVPVARVELPVRVPYGFHGAHITEAQLQQQVTAL
ncbi:hypothetical protein WJX75_000916 [Coccomyxa subellipsoidea]|uniref:carotenoid 9,10-dioxygenase n=1 Tax=Coccomyxa subellipsoidea TaxID=248742 RepID=A0ABR2Z2A4_9CHLO